MLAEQLGYVASGEIVIALFDGDLGVLQFAGLIRHVDLGAGGGQIDVRVGQVNVAGRHQVLGLAVELHLVGLEQCAGLPQTGVAPRNEGIAAGVVNEFVAAEVDFAGVSGAQAAERLDGLGIDRRRGEERQPE